jgi:DNA-binding IclR family transcriptional regulator
MAHDKNYIIREVCRTLDILEQFTASDGELSIFELSRRLALPYRRIRRHLKTLESRYFIEANRESGGYRLGPSAFATGQAFQRQTGLRRLARPLLEKSVNLCNETTSLAIMKNGHSLFLDTVESDHAVRIAPRVGLLLPSYCTAAGKIQLACMDIETRERHLLKLHLHPHTPTTIIGGNMLRTHLLETAHRGYAVDNEELDSGLRCVSAPVRNFTGRTVGAISISGPSTRLSFQRIRSELAPLITHIGEELSLQLGFVPPLATSRESRDQTGQQQPASKKRHGNRSPENRSVFDAGLFSPGWGENADLFARLAAEANDYTRPLQAE